MKDNDFSDKVPAPRDGAPGLLLRGPGVNLVFIVFKERLLSVAGVPEPRVVVGLAVKPWMIEPLAYAETQDQALDALQTIIQGFLALGYRPEHTVVHPSMSSEEVLRAHQQN